MILLAVQGGLGNQLFQYAFARHLSLPTDEPICIDQSFYHDPAQPKFRRLELCGLTARIARLLPPEVAAFPDKSGGPFGFEGRSFARFSDTSPWPASPRPANIALKGEWSAQTFHLTSPALLAALRAETLPLTPPTSPAYLHSRALIAAAASPVCIQIRRGEYKNMTRIFHYLAQPYYHAARAVIESTVPTPSYFIFSDEPDFVAQEVAPCTGLTILPALTPVESLDLARLCQHFICANSTFSYWSAVLAHRPGMVPGVVIVPRDYYTDPGDQAAYLADKSFYPASWIMV